MPSPILVIGIGNEYRSDDGVGLVVARGLRAKNLPDMLIIESSGDGAALMEAWKAAPSVIVIDAAASNGLLLSLHPRFRSSGSHWTRTRITATPATPDCVCHRRQKFHCWSRPFPQGCKGGAEGNRTDQPAAKFGLACIKRFRVYGDLW